LLGWRRQQGRWRWGLGEIWRCTGGRGERETGGRQRACMREREHLGFGDLGAGYIWEWRLAGHHRARLLFSCRAGPLGVLGWRPMPGHGIRVVPSGHGDKLVVRCLGRAKIQCFRAGRRAAGHLAIHRRGVAVDVWWCVAMWARMGRHRSCRGSPSLLGRWSVALSTIMSSLPQLPTHVPSVSPAPPAARGGLIHPSPLDSSHPLPHELVPAVDGHRLINLRLKRHENRH
jgi:hypothetical protein